MNVKFKFFPYFLLIITTVLLFVFTVFSLFLYFFVIKDPLQTKKIVLNSLEITLKTEDKKIYSTQIVENDISVIPYFLR